MINPMKKLYTMMVALAVTLFAATGFAWSPPASPAPASWISDNSHVLSASAHTRLDAKLSVINQSSANEVAALIVQTLDGQDISDVANTTFKSWGVGKKGLDNGVLVVLAIKDRKMRIETGKGVEGDLPDLKTQDIQNNVMRPRLKAGDVEGALGAGFDAIASSIANHKADVAAGRTGSGRQTPSCQASSVGSDSSGGLILLLVAGGTITLVWYLARQAKRRREQEEVQRLAALERQEARRRQVEEREAARKRDAERARQVALNKPTPVVQVPTVPRPSPTPRSTPRPHPVTTVAVPVAASVAASVAEDARRHAAEAARRRREQEEADARRARERADEDRRRRDREEEDRRSSYSSSSSSSFDWGGSSGGSDSGGFGGGDSGGGGSSSDW